MNYLFTTRRFYSQIKQVNECWEWQGSVGSSGYGRISVGTVQWLAHRYAYTLLVDDIPNNLVIDHLCRNTICVNPKHLEVVETKENIRRGEAGKIFGDLQKQKTHCPYGHAYVGLNLIIRKKGGRACRKCQNKRSKEYSRKKRSAII